MKCAVSQEFSEKNQKEQHPGESKNPAFGPTPNEESKAEDEEEKKRKKPHLELISSQAKTSEVSPQGYMELFTQFEEQRKEIRRSVGTKAYQVALKSQKKSGIFRKGAMLDEDIICSLIHGFMLTLYWP